MWNAVKAGNISGIYKYRLPLVRVMCENYEGQKMTYFALVKKTWWQLMQANTRKSKNRRNMSKKINKIERRPKYGNQTHSFGLKDFSVYRTYIHDRFCSTNLSQFCCCKLKQLCNMEGVTIINLCILVG